MLFRSVDDQKKRRLGLATALRALCNSRSRLFNLSNQNGVASNGRAPLVVGLQKDEIMLFRTRIHAAVAIAALAIAGGNVGHGDSKPAITKPGYDPSARKVELFKAIEEGLVDVKLIQMNAKNGNLIIDNKGKEPLTIQLPEAFVGVHVLNQEIGRAHV